jgi:hypothetical protein
MSLISWVGPWVETLLMATAVVWLWAVLAEDSPSSIALLVMLLAVTLGIGIYRQQSRASAARFRRALDRYADGEIAQQESRASAARFRRALDRYADGEIARTAARLARSSGRTAVVLTTKK